MVGFTKSVTVEELVEIAVRMSCYCNGNVAWIGIQFLCQLSSRVVRLSICLFKSDNLYYLCEKNIRHVIVDSGVRVFLFFSYFRIHVPILILNFARAKV